MKSILRMALVLTFLTGPTAVNALPEGMGQPFLVDRIVAVVNDEVITLNELHTRLRQAVHDMERRGIPLPPQDALEQQMLGRLIMDTLQLQFARENGWRVDDTQLEQAIARIAAGNGLSVSQFREMLQNDGISFDRFRADIRDEMTIARVREREVENKIVVSEGEIDHFLSAELSQGRNVAEYEVAHILLWVPESATPEQIQGARAKAEGIIERLRRGENFAQLAATYSDAPDGLQGGNLGSRTLDRLPSIFAESVTTLQVNEISPILRSPNGFHIIKLLSTSAGSVLPAVSQTHARHILIRVDELVSEIEARYRLEGLYAQIQKGADFAELARRFSHDGSASRGGDLGWIYPGDTVSDFEQAMNALQPGEVSLPVRSPFGFHLIQVLERRVQDISGDRKRALARQALRDRRFDETYQDWLRQLRDNAHIQIRLEEQ